MKTNEDVAIETRALTKKYGELTAVDALDLTVYRGELFALLGVNGAGKTTTIKMLSCISSPTSGDAIMLGNSITGDTTGIKKKINVSPQETAVAPNLTVAENLRLIAGIHGFRRDEADALAAEITERLGLGGISKKRAKTLSGGWQRRLSIAMALISKPQILFLDEPTLGLDVIARRELQELIRHLKGSVTIILTTHYLEEAQVLADRIGIMAGGKLVAVGTADELIAKTGAPGFEDAFISLAAASAPVRE